MPPWPSASVCRTLLAELGAPPDLVAHCAAVVAVAEPMARTIAGRGHRVDLALVVAGAWLHDVGRTRSQGLDHASIGAGLLRQRGFREPLCRVVERHTGGGIDAGEARALGLPVRDYTPRTLEERVVCQADNLVDGDRRQKVQEELAYLRGRGLERVATKIERLHRELSALAGRDLDDVT